MVDDIIIPHEVERGNLREMILGIARVLAENHYVDCRGGIRGINDVPKVFPNCVYGNTAEYINKLDEMNLFSISARLGAPGRMPAGKLRLKYDFRVGSDKGKLEFRITDNDEVVSPELRERVRGSIEEYFMSLKHPK